MNSQTYVSDPSLCDTFFKNMANKKFNPYKLRKNKIRQIGRGLHGRFRGSYIIPVNPNVVKEEGKKNNTYNSSDPCCCCRGKSSFRIQRRKEKPKTPQ